MKIIFTWVKNNPIRTMFLIPIILVALISISHVVTWYSIANPINWAIYLSIAIEIGAMTALVAATNRIQGGVWFMFGLVTLIQMIGNIFFSFKEIDETGELWKSWIELTAPIWEMTGTELTDTTGLKRWLAFLEGGLLPVISLTSLHFFVRYNRKKNDVNISKDELKEKVKRELLKEMSSTDNEKYEITEEDIDNKIKDTLDNIKSEDNKEDETEYLLKSEKNREHLEESIKQSEEIKDLYGESDKGDEKDVILKKAMDEYTNKNKEETPKTKKIDTNTGKINTPNKTHISKNIQRID